MWRAFRELPSSGLTYVDVGANEPRHLSITASLYDLGWRGLLIEADPEHAAQLRIHRPADVVAECAAADQDGELVFHRVPGTGLGSLDSAEAQEAVARGFETSTIQVPARRLSAILDDAQYAQMHFMSIDVEGAEASVLAGLDLHRHRPWVLCIESVLPGTSVRSHEQWEPQLLEADYAFVCFDGVNSWYVATEHAQLAVALAIPFNAIDAGADGWIQIEDAQHMERANRADIRRAWQRELLLHDIDNEVPVSEYEKQIGELRGALTQVEGSRTWKMARKASKGARIGQFKLRQGLAHLPGPVRTSLVRSRHLKHVIINQGHLTDPAYLGKPPVDDVRWINGENKPAKPAGGFELESLTVESADAAKAWLDAGPYDSDVMLNSRTDNHGDEIGRLAAALRLRLKLEQLDAGTTVAGNRILFDARSLQTSAFGARGIGRFALAALRSARESTTEAELVLLIDPALEQLPPELAGNCRQIVRVRADQAAEFSLLIQPSPMTASAEPLVALLLSNAHKLALVFDFIPMHYPTIYLNNLAARAEYAAGLDALRKYDEFVCISLLAEQELRSWISPSRASSILTSVAWPRDVFQAAEQSSGAQVRNGPIVVMTGDEPRKNTYGALAAIGAATAGGSETREVVVLGMAGQQTRVHHWSIAAAFRPGEAITLDRVSDEQMHALLQATELVVVASFDEGLSLPIIEALRAGAPVVASDIPAHRELIGSDSYLAPPADIAALARAIRRHRGKGATARREIQILKRHAHDELEETISNRIRSRSTRTDGVTVANTVPEHRQQLSIGIGTPWLPQKSGVADFSAAVTVELAKLADVTVYTTTDAKVDGLKHANIDAVLADGHDHDVFVCVVGNSHFHVPYIEALRTIDAVAVAHDTRMVEYYMAMRGQGGVEQVMTRGSQQSGLDPSLDDQIDDMRLLQNAGFWEIAHQAQMLVLHSPSAAPRIEQETGIAARVLPFANQRVPDIAHITEEVRAAARARLGFDPELVHIGSFGYVDLRTKLTDVVVEAAAWLSQWGHRVSVHLVGAASDEEVRMLTKRAEEAGIAEFEITGFASESQFRDYLLAVDLGVQLRVSPLLGVSGPLSDLAAFGTTSIASSGLAIDVGTPAYVDRLPDDVSSLMVAEAIEFRLMHPIDAELRESQRREYLEAMSPARYARNLLALLEEVAQGQR